MDVKRKKLWEFAVLCHPTKKEAEEGKESELVLKPDFMIAASENEVVLKVSRNIPEEWMEKADRLEVAVRPF